MSIIDGPAFPLAFTRPDTSVMQVNNGMTLRDYFAAHALAGICANSESLRGQLVEAAPYGDPYRVVAANCYRMADSMLMERMT